MPTTNSISYSDFTLAITDPSFSASQINGSLVVAKTESSVALSVGVHLKPRFRLTGAFRVTVDVSWEMGVNIIAGMKAKAASGGHASIYHLTQSGGYAVSSRGDSGFVSNSPMSDGKRRLQIIRTSDGYVKAQYWSTADGGKWEDGAAAYVPDPITLELFMAQDRSTRTSTGNVAFDNLMVVCDGIAGSLSDDISIAKCVRICFPTELGRYYTIEATSVLNDPQSAPWSVVRSNIPGTGESSCTVETIQGFDTHYYRLRVSN